MSIRKEQALFLVAAALGLLIWSGMESKKHSSRLRYERQGYESRSLPDEVVVEPSDRGVSERDPFRVPSETDPLPPRIIEFPVMRPLSVVLPPLFLGQQSNAYHQLRVPGGVVERVQLSGGGARSANGSAPGFSGDTGAGGDFADQGGSNPIDAFDKVFLEGMSAPFIGFIKSADKYALATKKFFGDETVILERVNRKTGRVMLTMDLTPDSYTITRIELAKTLRNRIELRKRELGAGPASLKDRGPFIDELLAEARKEFWVYAEAEEQAEQYVEISKRAEEGYRYLVRVLRAQGDIAKEWNLLTGLEDSAFKERALGLLKSRLGLSIDAEKHLREAVKRGTADPRSRLALAFFLCDQNRFSDALEHAEAARRNSVVLSSNAERFNVLLCLIRVHLASGNLEVARNLLGSLPSDPRGGGVAAAVDYARGERKAGLAARFAASGGGDAALGRAVCLMIEGQWSEAERAFYDLADQYPVWRHLGFAGLALLYERTGNREQAIASAEAAATAHPRDPYVQYVLGRQRRLLGQLDGAQEVLRSAIARDGRLVEAMAELVRTHLAQTSRAGADPVEVAENLYKARRYADRLVESDSQDGGVVAIEYLELQGLVRYRAQDLKAARKAFEMGADRSFFCRIGLAIVDYAEKRIEMAQGRLIEIRDSLRISDPNRSFTENVLEQIGDHAQKEQLRDVFERGDLGGNWTSSANGTVKPRLRDGALSIRGILKQPGRSVIARRVQPTGGNFLAVEVDMEINPGHRARDAFLQVGFPKKSAEGTSDFSVSFGVHDKKPYLLIEDGDRRQARDQAQRENWEPVRLSGGLNTLDPIRLALRVIPRDEVGRRFMLRAFWNGRLVHERKIERLNSSTRTELNIDLVSRGTVGQEADVLFDNFLLIRRKEK